MAGELAVRKSLEKSLRATSLSDLVRAKEGETFLLLDCSGSMHTPMRNGKARIDGLREAFCEIRDCGAAFKTVAFGPGYVQFCIEPPNPGGGTPTAEAIEFARIAGAGRCIMISDGEPNDPHAAIDAALKFGGRIDVIFVGDPGDYGEAFMKRLADVTGGEEFKGDLSAPKLLADKVVALLSDGVNDDEA